MTTLPIPLLPDWFPALVPLWGLGFSNPLLLWGMGAASLPIIIHLLNRRRFRETQWAAMRFLLAAIKKNQRRIRIEQLAAAGRAHAPGPPRGPGDGQAVPGEHGGLAAAPRAADALGPRARRLDEHGRCHDGEATRFDQAKALAGQLVKSSRQGDALSVVLLADPPRVVIGTPAVNRDTVLKEIDQIEPTHGGGDLGRPSGRSSTCSTPRRSLARRSSS